MPRSAGPKGDPAPGAYRPHGAAGRPGGRPAVKPVFRVLVHRQFLGLWNELPNRVGLANAQQFWDHVAMTPGQPPKVGTFDGHSRFGQFQENLGISFSLLTPQVAARAFEAFFTTKDVSKGAGLGLDIARRIVVERHGGTIAIDSWPSETVRRVRILVRPPGEARPAS